MRLGGIFIATIAVATASCVSQFYQASDEAPRARRPLAPVYAAATYHFSSVSGDLGAVRVSAGGLYLARVQGAYRTGVEVNVRIENVSRRALQLNLNSLRLDWATADHQILRNISLSQMSGHPAVGPDDTQSMSLYFLLPEGTKVQALQAFQLRWQLESWNAIYELQTPFTRVWDEEYLTRRYYYVPSCELFRGVPQQVCQAGKIERSSYHQQVR